MMAELLPPTGLLLPFLLASFLLAITPGPAVLYLVARSLTQGRQAGLVSVVGVALGNMVNAIAACIGLAAVFAVSALAFSVVKYAGAAYLIAMGIRALRQPATVLTPGELPRQSLGRIFHDGLIVAALNPKTTLFFAAFLPQFLSSPDAPLSQSLVLASFFVLVAALTDLLYALAAGSFSGMLQRRSGLARSGRWLSGGTFVGLGVMTALSDSKPAG